MYLVSIYFDEKTNLKMCQYIEAVAVRSGNELMIKGQVPPHITISSFETKEEEKVIACLREAAAQMMKGRLQMACVGAFPSNALFIAPVVNGYLHTISTLVYRSISKVEGIKVSRYYQPFQWMPHLTIAKKLSKEEMSIAFQELQERFCMFEAEVTKIGLAKTNPYREIINWELE